VELTTDSIRFIEQKKSFKIKDFEGLFKISVHPSGEVSNLLLEDYDAVTKFMDAEMEKKRFKL